MNDTQAVVTRPECAQHLERQANLWLGGDVPVCEGCARLELEVYALRAQLTQQADQRISEQVRHAEKTRRRERQPHSAPPGEHWAIALKLFIEQLNAEYAEGKRIGYDAGQQAATLLDLGAASMALGFFFEHEERMLRLGEKMEFFARQKMAHEIDRLYVGNSVSAALREGRPETLEV